MKYLSIKQKLKAEQLLVVMLLLFYYCCFRQRSVAEAIVFSGCSCMSL